MNQPFYIHQSAGIRTKELLNGKPISPKLSAACIKIPYRGLTISIACDDSCGAGNHLFRTELIVDSADSVNLIGELEPFIQACADEEGHELCVVDSTIRMPSLADLCIVRKAIDAYLNAKEPA